MAWWQDPITQAHGVNGEQGVDLGTPFHTTLTEILGGTVQRVDCSDPWACEIDVSTVLNGQSFVEGYLHVDDPFVTPGQVLTPGETIGLSGGEITSMPGAQHIDSPNVSTGPHTEYDLWRGSSPWQGAIDPTAIVQAGPGVGGPSSSSDGSSAQNTLDLILSLFPGLAKLANPNVQQAGQQASGALSGLVNINVDPFGALGQQVTGVGSSLGSWIHDRAVPFAGANVLALIVAAAVILIIFGTGDRQSGGSPVPMPVPV